MMETGKSLSAKGETVMNLILIIGIIIVSVITVVSINKITAYQIKSNQQIAAQNFVRELRDTIQKMETNPSDSSYIIKLDLLENYQFTIANNRIDVYFPRLDLNLTEYFFVSTINTIPNSFSGSGIVRVNLVDRDLYVTDKIICDLNDAKCDPGCMMLGFCDPVCYDADSINICLAGCLDINSDHEVNYLDRDNVCDKDCYNSVRNGGIYDVDCILTNDSICDPDTHMIVDTVCDEDCSGANGVCDPDCRDFSDVDCLSCGDGVFEPDEGETCENCPDDYSLPLRDSGETCTYDCECDYGLTCEETGHCCRYYETYDGTACVGHEGNNICEQFMGENCANDPDCACTAPDICCPGAGETLEGCAQPGILPLGDTCSCDAQCTTGSCCNNQCADINLAEGESCDCEPQCGIGLNCNENDIGTGKNCCPDDEIWDGTACVGDVQLKVLFVPVNWQGHMSFDTAANNQMDKIIQNIPLSSCPSKAEGVAIHNNCVFNHACNCADITRIQQCADASGEDYDYVVGLTDADVCGSTLGFSCNSGTVFSETSNLIVSVHELGHEWGLNDEYVDACKSHTCDVWNRAADAPGSDGIIDDFGYVSASNCLNPTLDGYKSLNPNPPFPDYCNGNSCPPSYDVLCYGNRNAAGGRSIMSFGNAPGPREFDSECKSHLATIPFLNC